MAKLKLVKIGEAYLSPLGIEVIGLDPDNSANSMVAYTNSGAAVSVHGMHPKEVLDAFNRAIETGTYGDPEP